MKICIAINLIILSQFAYTQQMDAFQKLELKQNIVQSQELVEWQSAMVLFQKSDIDFCALKNEQKLNQNLFIAFDRPRTTKTLEKFTLELFRTMRVTNELRDSTILKESELRRQYPQLATHFSFHEIFSELYTPIKEARESYLKQLLRLN